MFQPLASWASGVTRSLLLTSSLLTTLVTAQHVGHEQAELHPQLKWQRCSAPGSCSTVNGEIVLDSNWRWSHDRASSQNCYEGNVWIPKFCPDGKTCSDKCAIDGGLDYKDIYGITTNNDSLTMNHVTRMGFGSNFGSRVFLMADENKYQMFNLLGNEFSFDVDASKLGCGINGALSFVAMDEDGGMARFPGNKAGAKYGTGYCSALCPRNLKWIDGKANSEGWYPSADDDAQGTGLLGSCCPEVNVWDANAHSTALTIRPCTKLNQHKCLYSECTGSNILAGDRDRVNWLCARDGCDFNPYRQGDKGFYGRGSSFAVDTNQKVTVVTQFPRGANKDLGSGAVKRFYVQNGKVIPNAASRVPGVGGKNQIDRAFCNAQKEAFEEYDDFEEKGGMAQMGNALERPMVLSFSILDDWHAHMLWLDSKEYPLDGNPDKPGVGRGPCDVDSGQPWDVRAQRNVLNVSNIKFGPINSTFSAV